MEGIHKSENVDKKMPELQNICVEMCVACLQI